MVLPESEMLAVLWCDVAWTTKLRTALAERISASATIAVPLCRPVVRGPQENQPRQFEIREKFAATQFN
jgi:hypothetical protein